MALEHPKGMLARVASRMPRTWLEQLRNLSPTMIYLIHKRNSLDGSEAAAEK
jgi:hypothetical protein